MIRNPNIPTVNGLPVPYKMTWQKRDNRRVLCNLPCVLYAVMLDYQGPGDVYLQIFEGHENPGNGMTPTLPPIPITPNAFTYFDFTPGIPFVGGVGVAISTTRDSLTLATDDAIFNAVFYPLDVLAP